MLLLTKDFSELQHVLSAGNPGLFRSEQMKESLSLNLKVVWILFFNDGQNTHQRIESEIS
jgi:hypothetical protein